MKVFVLGRTRSGKTPFARMVAAGLGVPVASASAWVRARFPGELSDDRAEATRALTAFATAELVRDPAVSYRHLAAAHDLSASLVVEAMRNPYDFVRAFDAREDHAVFLDHAGNDLPVTLFERGLEVIDAYLAWLRAAGLLEEGRVHRYRFAEFRPGLDFAAADLLAALPRPIAAAPRPAFVHAEVPPLRVHVRKELLHGGDAQYAGQLEPATVFAVSSYPGFAPYKKMRNEWRVD